MRRLITATLLALLALGGLAAPAQAGRISGELEGDSVFTPISPGVFLQNFSGDGDDTIYGPFTPVSQSTVDFSNPPNILISNGTFTETFPHGTLSGTSSGSGTASGQGTATVTLDLVFTGGTGIFVGATGEATFTGTLDRTSPTTASISGTYVGTLSGVPEPSTLILLAHALVVGAVVLVRQPGRTATAH
jgi:hypothetical protein